MTEQTTNFPVQESLAKDTQALAEELNIFSSHLVAIALKEFIRRNQHRQRLANEISKAYIEPSTEEEKALRQHSRISYRKIVKGEW